jgi:hypothetical protein
MKTIQHTRFVYKINPWDPTPQVIKEALERARKQEHDSKLAIDFIASIWGQLYNILKTKGKTKRKQSRVRFSNTVNIHCTSKPENVAKQSEISDKIGREISSGPILEKIIIQFFLLGSDIGFSKKWNDYIGGTHDSLLNELMNFDISLEDLSKDFKKIITYFENGNVAILGYRSSWKLLPTYSYHKQRQNAITLKQEFSKTKKKFKLLPKFRLYLIKIIKDHDFAAKVIQDAWKKKQASL